MLDKNAMRALVDGHAPRLDGWFADQRCCISVIVAAEIRYGLRLFLWPLALMDLLIASHVLSEGCALVTADQAFSNVPELQLESW
jgi:tRNA(fMet)-specific endonuclease VapC